MVTILEEVLKKKNALEKLILNVLDEADNNEVAARQITSVIVARREHVEGLDGMVALQNKWTETQCHLMIELLG